MPLSHPGSRRNCDSCGSADDALYPVRRRYVTPAAWDTSERDVVLDDVERWCFSCCTHYPHVVAEGPSG